MSIGDVLGSIGKGIASFAPTLATMLGGPLAGTAVTAIEGALGINSDSKSSLADRAGSIAQMLQNAQLTGDQIVQMKLAEAKHAEIIGQQGIDLAKINADHQEAWARIDAQDRDSARQREEAVKDNTPSRLAYMIVGGFFVFGIAQVVALVGLPDLVAKVPAAAWAIIGNIGGYLAAEAKAATGYYFGSSSGSAKKDDTIKAALSQ